MPVQFRDYYETLDVPRTATDEEIRKKYRKLARKYHPDVNPGDKSAEEKFKEINEAYQVLSDPEKRKRYDQLGANWKNGAEFTPPPGRNGAGVEFGDFGDFFGGERGPGEFSDFFESLFGRRAGRADFQRRGRDIEAELPLTLEEAHGGGTRTITFEASESCPDCGGTGQKDGKRCPTCRGSGVVRRTRSLEITIPAGVRDGSVIRLAGQGEPGGNGRAAGDLLLHVRLEPHALFEVVGDGDVEIELPVAPWEAALGTKVTVPTLDGPVEMTVRPGAQTGQRLRLRGQGMNRRGGGRGDEFVRLKIVVPSQLSAREKELFAKLAQESHFNPRQSLEPLHR